jgi:hypothetical protein
MKPTKTLRRIVTCQGGIQLIAAMAAMSARESEQKQAGYEYQYEDVLVVYDLYAPHGQIEAFASFVRKMALAVNSWKSIVYLTPEQIEVFAASLDVAPTSTVLDEVRKIVGASDADEIFLCRNWQFGNRLMIHTYRKAEKICYGDGIGFYFSEAYFSPATENGTGLKSLVRGKLRRLKNSLRARIKPLAARPVVNRAGQSTVLGEVDFDVGYFLLPNILDQQPPMKTRLVSKDFTEQIFRKLAATLDTNKMADRFKNLTQFPTVVLMTSNFSEAARMSGEKEIVAYRKFLEQLDFPRNARLIIKPHPRDGEGKIRELGRVLSDLFGEVILLTDPNLFFVPFEILLMQTFKGANERALRELKIVTFSSACLSLEVLFHVQPIVGFGNELVKKFFYETYAGGRIKHEYDLRMALKKLAQIA